MVTFGMDLLSRENSCSSLVGWKLPGLPDLSWKVVGEVEVVKEGGREAVREEEKAGVLVGDRETGTEFYTDTDTHKTHRNKKSIMETTQLTIG